MASLFVVRGRDQGRHFSLSADLQRIGRDATSSIQLFDSEVSRGHAEIRRRDGTGQFEIVDLGSSNGTLVNGVRVSRHPLTSGDRIELGGTLMIFTGTGPPATLDAAHGVDIVQQSRHSDASRIVSSLRPGEDRHAGHASDAQKSLEVIYLTAIAVGRSENIETVLARILHLVFDWVEADRGCIMLRDRDNGRLRPAARCDRDARPAGEATAEDTAEGSSRISISHTILDYVIQRKEGVRTSDASDDDRFEAAASIVTAGVREALCVPLQGRYGIVGALYVDTYSSPGQLIRSGGKQRFNDDHLRLMTAIGHQAALAIEDTFYYSALLQSERLAAMGQTIATLSHHVKNILQGIRGGSYLIDAGLQRGDNEAVRKGWAIVERNQERISDLVLDMLSFSKDREPDKVDADLNETVADVIELMQTHANQMGVSLRGELAADLPAALFDPEGIHRAVLNLVTNAIDASSPRNRGGDVSVDADEPSVTGTADRPADPTPTPAPSGNVVVRTRFIHGEGWHIDVVDDGPGVPEDQREKIFSLFESNKGSRGTGLGLPVSAKILREHGGDIAVLPAQSGTGSCFRIRLPAEVTTTSELSRHDTLS